MSSASGREAQDPRVERTRNHVLDHALDLLVSAGPGAVTYTALATRAKVTRQTLYRHWPAREQLFVDLVLRGALPAMPDLEGSAQEVVRLFLRRLRDGLQEPSNAAPLTALVAQADQDPMSAAALAGIVDDVRSALDALLRRAGHEVGPQDYACLVGPVVFQRFFARQAASDELVDQLVTTWWLAQHRTEEER